MAAAGARNPGGQEPRAVRKALLLLEAVARLGPGATARAIADYAEVRPGRRTGCSTCSSGTGTWCGSTD